MGRGAVRKRESAAEAIPLSAAASVGIRINRTSERCSKTPNQSFVAPLRGAIWLNNHTVVFSNPRLQTLHHSVVQLVVWACCKTLPQKSEECGVRSVELLVAVWGLCNARGLLTWAFSPRGSVRTVSQPPRSGEMFVAVGSAYSRYPRFRE